MFDEDDLYPDGYWQEVFNEATSFLDEIDWSDWHENGWEDWDDDDYEW